jgi:hypothetical protein
VRLILESERFFEDPVFAQAVTKEDGTFAFERVIPGEYVARVFETSSAPSGGAFRSAEDIPTPSSSRSPRSASAFGSATVVVGDSNLNNIEIALRPAMRIAGHVVFNGNAPKPRLNEIAGYLQPEPPNGKRGSLTRTSGSAEADFSFQTGEIPAGRYFVRWPAGVRSGWSTESVTLNGSDAFDKPIVVDNSNVEGVVVTLTDRVSEVTGVVRTTTNAPDLNAAVIVFPADRALWSDYGFTSPRMGYTRPAEDGVYSIRGLPAGDYLAVAVDDALTELWQSRAFLELWSAGATRFTVAIGAKQTVDLRTARPR